MNGLTIKMFEVLFFVLSFNIQIRFNLFLFVLIDDLIDLFDWFNSLYRCFKYILLGIIQHLYWLHILLLLLYFYHFLSFIFDGDHLICTDFILLFNLSFCSLYYSLDSFRTYIVLISWYNPLSFKIILGMH